MLEQRRAPRSVVLRLPGTAPTHTVPRAEANVIVIARNSESSTDVSLRAGVDQLLDVAIPGCPAFQSNDPSVSYGYHLARGQVALLASATNGPPAATSLRVTDRVQWILLQAQPGFPVYLKCSVIGQLWADRAL